MYDVLLTYVYVHLLRTYVHIYVKKCILTCICIYICVCMT